MQKKKKKCILTQIASEKQNSYKYILEDDEDTSFSCDTGVCVPMSFCLQRVEGLV